MQVNPKQLSTLLLSDDYAHKDEEVEEKPRGLITNFDKLRVPEYREHRLPFGSKFERKMAGAGVLLLKTIAPPFPLKCAKHT